MERTWSQHLEKRHTTIVRSSLDNPLQFGLKLSSAYELLSNIPVEDVVKAAPELSNIDPHILTRVGVDG